MTALPFRTFSEAQKPSERIKKSKINWKLKALNEGIAGSVFRFVSRSQSSRIHAIVSHFFRCELWEYTGMEKCFSLSFAAADRETFWNAQKKCFSFFFQRLSFSRSGYVSLKRLRNWTANSRAGEKRETSNGIIHFCSLPIWRYISNGRSVGVVIENRCAAIAVPISR